MSVIKSKITYVFIVMFILSGMFSCNKPSRMDREVVNDEDMEMAAINENDLMESDEDLLNVDYREFYDELAPHGEWIEVTDKDIGLDLKKETSSSEKHGRTISISDLFGVKDAYAGGVAFGAFFIWRPSPELAVSIVAGEPEPYYVPYANGQWVYTDAGWYFAAPTYYEEIVHHYGRWIYSPALGWVWVPGRVWAPAWVEWRVSPGYVAWMPLAPSVYIVNNYIYSPPIYENRFIIVENRYFYEPFIYKYKHHGNKIFINEMTRVDGIKIVNNRIYNYGPELTVIEKDRGSKIDIVKINRVKDIKDVKHAGSEINSYSPDFKRIKNKGSDSPGTFKPNKYESFSDKKSRMNNDKNITGDNKNQGSDDKNHPDKLKQNDNKNRDVLKNNDKKNKDNNITKDNNKNRNKDNSQNKGGDKKIQKQNKPENKVDKSPPEKKKNSGNDNNKNGSNDNKGKDNSGKNDNKGKGKK